MPIKMAEIYWNRLRGRSFREVDILIKRLEDSPTSQAYWVLVRSILDGCGISKEKKH